MQAITKQCVMTEQVQGALKYQDFLEKAQCHTVCNTEARVEHGRCSRAFLKYVNK